MNGLSAHADQTELVRWFELGAELLSDHALSRFDGAPVVIGGALVLQSTGRWRRPRRGLLQRDGARRLSSWI